MQNCPMAQPISTLERIMDTGKMAMFWSMFFSVRINRTNITIVNRTRTSVVRLSQAKLLPPKESTPTRPLMARTE